MIRSRLGTQAMAMALALIACHVAAQETRTLYTPEQSQEAVASLAGWLETKSNETLAEDLSFATTPLSREDAAQAAAKLWQAHVDDTKDSFARDWTEKRVQASDKTMKFEYKIFGQKPEQGWSLYISMHGGGGTTSKVNDQQWQNQIKLYEPNEGIYVAPRAPTDAWNLWHQAHIDPLFDRLIQGAVIHRGVNVNRVFIMGYSAGGDGVYQLAPRMADQLAAAAMMAGHPNDADPAGLRNIGFTVHMGELDKAYKRNEVAAQWKEKLATLRESDPSGYAHEVQIHPGMGHWMQRKDAVALAWMDQFTRTPWPDKVVWHQDDVTHSSFYWVAVSDDNLEAHTHVEVERQGQNIRIGKASGLKALTFLLNDHMMDLDQSVSVFYQGKCLFEGLVPRQILVLDQSLKERGDQALMFSARVTVHLGGLEQADAS